MKNPGFNAIKQIFIDKKSAILLYFILIPCLFTLK